MTQESGLVIPQQGVIDLKALTGQVIKSSGQVLLFALVFGLVAFFVAIRPIPYEVHATVNVEPVSLGGILSSASSNMDTEEGRIKSWTTIERIIDTMGRYGIVNIKSAPKKMNLLEQVFYFLRTGKKHREMQNMPIQVDEMRFPEALNGKQLYLKVIDSTHYVVERGNGDKLFEGVVGDADQKGGVYTFRVSQINVPAGSVFTVTPLSKETMVERVLATLKVTKRTANRGASLIDLNFFSSEPYFALRLVEFLVNDYVNESYERIASSKRHAIEDLSKELERAGIQLSQSEDQLGDYMKDIDVADVEAEMRGQLEMRLSLEQSLRQVQLQKAQLKQVYTAGHPAMKAAQEKEVQLKAKLKMVHDRLATLPEIKGKLYTMNRRVEQNAAQYESILQQYTQLKIDASSVSNYVSIVNLPRLVRRDLRNKAIQIVVLGIMMGVIIALGLIVIRSNLHGNVLEDVQQLGVFPILSVSDIDPARTHRSYNGKYSENLQAIDDIVAQFSYLASQKKNNITVVTSDKTTPRKSRLTLKMAQRFAEKNGRVLLIDANVKDSYLAKHLGYAREEGFANAMVGKMPSSDIIHRIDNSDLYYMPPGEPPMSIQILRDFKRFDYLLAEFGKLFDRIIVDLPSQLELPFWQTLISRTGTTIHFLEKGGPIDNAMQYMHTVSELAKAKPETLHEVLLHAHEEEKSGGFFGDLLKRD